MASGKPFRFGAIGEATTREGWAELARTVEARGFSTLLAGDHPAGGGLAPLPALVAAADATTTLRLGTHVLANDFRNPVLLAQEAATLDVLSGGRFELGIGTGWWHADYNSIGVAFDSPGTRVSRLAEAVPLIKRLLQEDAVTFEGNYYRVQSALVTPKPVQRPYPPIMIGGGGRRILSLAAREADIVSLDPVGTPEGTKDLATITAEALEQQLGWVRTAAGARFDSLELQTLIYAVAVTDDRRQTAEQLVEFLAGLPPSFMCNTRRTMEEVLTSVRFLIGTHEEIAEQLLERRERYGISYIAVLDLPGLPSNIDALSPIVTKLAGT
ncbi:MAG TPA: TIGR03621 family F420-dependent LLM class oxidoreductase [Roseiflexaceae bacterium]|nr:TIGR03621 family F420-dependent LLM class oxidoreductase [Roseiflexaceae bacterium]